MLFTESESSLGSRLDMILEPTRMIFLPVERSRYDSDLARMSDLGRLRLCAMLERKERLVCRLFHLVGARVYESAYYLSYCVTKQEGRTYSERDPRKDQKQEE